MPSKTLPFLTGFILCLLSVSAEKPNVLFILVDDMGWKDLSNEGLDLLRKSERRPYRRGRNEVHQGVCKLSGLQPLPGKYPDWQVSDQPWNHDLDRRPLRRRSMAGHRAARQPPFPEYERNLRPEITLAEAMKAGGYKTFFAGKWHLGAKDLGPPTMASKSTRAVGALAVREEAFSLLGRTRIWNPVRRENLSLADRKPPTLSRKTRAFLSRIPFLLHGSRPDPDHASALEKIPGKSRESRAGQEAFRFRPTAQRPPSPRLPDLRRNDRVDGPCHRDGPRQA